MLGGKKNMILASLEPDHLPHCVLYFLLAEQVVLEITVPLSLHVISCLCLDILLCSYRWSFLTSLFSPQKHSLTLSCLLHFSSCVMNLNFQCFGSFLQHIPLTSPPGSHSKIHSEGKTKLLFPKNVFISQQYPRTGALNSVFSHGKEFSFLFLTGSCCFLSHFSLLYIEIKENYCWNQKFSATETLLEALHFVFYSRYQVFKICMLICDLNATTLNSWWKSYNFKILNTFQIIHTFK